MSEEANTQEKSHYTLRKRNRTPAKPVEKPRKKREKIIKEEPKSTNNNTSNMNNNLKKEEEVMVNTTIVEETPKSNVNVIAEIPVKKNNKVSISSIPSFNTDNKVIEKTIEKLQNKNATANDLLDSLFELSQMLSVANDSLAEDPGCASLVKFLLTIFDKYNSELSSNYLIIK